MVAHVTPGGMDHRGLAAESAATQCTQALGANYQAAPPNYQADPHYQSGRKITKY